MSHLNRIPFQIIKINHWLIFPKNTKVRRKNIDLILNSKEFKLSIMYFSFYLGQINGSLICKSGIKYPKEKHFKMDEQKIRTIKKQRA